MKNLFENVVKQLLTENTDNTNAKIELVSGGKGFYLYHCAFEETIENIALVGNRRQYTAKGAGNLYGDGVYTTYTLKSSIINASSWKYGDVIVKLLCTDNIKDYIIFDPIVCRQAHGKDLLPSQQFERILKPHQDVWQKIINKWPGTISAYDSYYKENYYTAHGAQPTWANYLSGMAHYGALKYIRGLIFSGQNDGNVCVVFRFASCHPIAMANRSEYSKEIKSYDKNGNMVHYSQPQLIARDEIHCKFHPIDTQNYIYRSIADNVDLYKELYPDYTYFRTEGFSNGYAVVGNGRLYRILSHYLYNRGINGDGRICNLWFDEVYGVSFSNGVDSIMKVKYKGVDYILKRIDVENYDVYDMQGHYLCDLNELEQRVKDQMKQPQQIPQQAQQQPPQQPTQSQDDLDAIGDLDLTQFL